MPRAEWRTHMRDMTSTADIKAASAALDAAPRARAREGETGTGSGDDGTAHRFAKDQLKAFVERIERMHEEKKAISDDIADIYREAKGNGFDVKSLRIVIRLRGQDVNERKEQEAIVETYMHALGMI